MALPGYDKLRTFTQGDAADFDVWYRHVPSGQRIVSAILIIKRNAADSNDAALYRVTITPTATAEGDQIIADGGTDVTGIAYRNLGTVRQGTAVLHWILTDTFTATLTPGNEYVYGVQVRSSAGRPYEPEHGVLNVIQQANIG
jgi:hypothetical protein